MATLHLMIGLPGSGKTTLAKRLEAELPAMRFTPDELMRPLFGEDDAAIDAGRYPVEDVCWKFAASALRLGVDAILDFGMWAREERDDYRARATALGAVTKIYYLEVPFEELLRRVMLRNEMGLAGELRMTEEQLRDAWRLFQPPSPEELGAP